MIKDIILEQDGWKIITSHFRGDNPYTILCPCWEKKEYLAVLKVSPVCSYHIGKMPERLNVAWHMITRS